MTHLPQQGADRASSGTFVEGIAPKQLSQDSSVAKHQSAPLNAHPFTESSEEDSGTATMSPPSFSLEASDADTHLPGGNSEGGSDTDGGLPSDLKRGLEALSGFAMDDVKVHHNSGKPAAMGAHAFAQGDEIYLGRGKRNTCHMKFGTWYSKSRAA